MSNEHNTKLIESKFENYDELLHSKECILWLEFERRMGYSPNYHSGSSDAALIRILLERYGHELQKNPELVWVPRVAEPVEIPEKRPADYCEVGSARCFSCSWQGKYPVSGCPICHRSFCD